MGKAKGRWLMFIDDDDTYLKGAFDHIKGRIDEDPDRPVLFKMRYVNGRTLWDEEKVITGNIGTPMILCRNDDGVGWWEPVRQGDATFIKETIERNGGVVWDQHVIAEVAAYGTSVDPINIPAMPATPKRKYYTLKKDVPLKKGQTVGFLSGKGYFVKAAPKPKDVPKGEAKNDPPFTNPAKPKPRETPKQAYIRWLLWGVKNNAEIHYAEARPMPVHLPAGSLPLTTDCSGWVTLCAKWAGRPDPNGLNFSGEGYTGTMLNHCEHIRLQDAEPGDLIVYGGGGGHHVVSITKVLAGDDFETVSHGQEKDPIVIKHSVEQKFQPLPATFLRFG